MNFFKKNKLQEKQDGAALMLVLLVLGNIFIVATAIGVFSLSQFRISTSARDSAYAIFAATSGLEKSLYEIRKNNDCVSYVSPLEQTISVDSKYEIIVDSPDCATSVTIKSYGTHKQTRRAIEASW